MKDRIVEIYSCRRYKPSSTKKVFRTIRRNPEQKPRYFTKLFQKLASKPQY